MTNTKTTKRALLSSVVALFLCFAMLIGTTYAWFSDSASTGSNVIKTGNLDIKVEYTLDGENWDDLDGATDLFQKGLWEPGHTEVVALRISNVGTLALKYTASMNIFNEVVGKNKDGGDIVLSDILTVSSMPMDGGAIGGVLAGTIFSGDDAAIWQSSSVNNSSFKAGNVLANDNIVLAGQDAYVLIKVDMDGNVGNEANHDGVNIPSIEFGINVLATQYTNEKDSFGHEYDKEATYDESWNALGDTSWYNTEAAEFTLTNAYQLAGLAKLVNTGVDSFAGKTVKLANNVDLENKAWRTIGTSSATAFAGTFDGNGKTVSNLLVETENSFGGLFGYVLKNSAISNLTVNNVVVTDEIEGDDTTCYGGVIGYCPGAVTLENVHVTGNVQISGDWYAGGIIGRSNGSVIKNCSVIATEGSMIESYRWAGGISAYDNGKHKTSGCVVENLTVQSQSFVGGLLGLSGKYSTVNDNTVKNVTVNLVQAEEKYTQSYGAIMGGLCVYNWDNSYLTAYNNVADGVSCTVNGATVEAQDMGMKYPEDNDYGMIKEATIKIGDVYFTSLKAAMKYVPKDNTQTVIELLDDTIVPSNFKPELANAQNVLIKTNGHQLLWVKVDTSAGKPNTDANGDLVTTAITDENMSSYIKIASGGTLVIE